MSCLLKLPCGSWLSRNKPTERIDLATIYPHPSAARVAAAKHPGSTIVPFSDVRDEWTKARYAAD